MGKLHHLLREAVTNRSVCRYQSVLCRIHGNPTSRNATSLKVQAKNHDPCHDVRVSIIVRVIPLTLLGLDGLSPLSASPLSRAPLASPLLDSLLDSLKDPSFHPSPS
jgi:hypothetical protein